MRVIYFAPLTDRTATEEHPDTLRGLERALNSALIPAARVPAMLALVRAADAPWGYHERFHDYGVIWQAGLRTRVSLVPDNARRPSVYDIPASLLDRLAEIAAAFDATGDERFARHGIETLTRFWWGSYPGQADSFVKLKRVLGADAVSELGDVPRGIDFTP